MVATGQPVSDPGGDKPQPTEDQAGPVAAGQPVSDPGGDKPQPTEDQGGPVAAGLLSKDPDLSVFFSGMPKMGLALEIWGPIFLGSRPFYIV